MVNEWNCESSREHSPESNQVELFNLFEKLDIKSDTIEHPPLFTVADSQNLRGEISGAHTKNLFVKDKKGNIFLITAEENAVVDLKNIHHKIGASGRVSFGKPDLLLELLGVTPGSVTIFGVINDKDHRVKVVIDETLLTHETINAHPLTNTATTTIATKDLLRFLDATGHEPLIISVGFEEEHISV